MTDDTKRDLNKSKRTKTDHIKSVIASYLQKRNYSSINVLKNIEIQHQFTYSLVESEISRRNSILYSCYNSDPIVIDHGFAKFVLWLKDLLKYKDQCSDLENLVGPLFCHLYLDILKGGHSERAAQFFKTHLPAIDKSKCDEFVENFINTLACDGDATHLKEQYRSNKYYLELQPESIECLKKYLTENCHVVFLHILQTWFDLQEVPQESAHVQDMENEDLSSDADSSFMTNGDHADGNKFQQMLDVIKDLESRPKQVFTLSISNTKDPITTGLIRRQFGFVAYNQDSVLHLRAIHSFDPIVGREGLQEITLMNHSKQIYSIAMSPDGQTLVTASGDCTLCLYNLSNLDDFKVCKGHLGPVYHTSVSSNNMYVASGSQDTTARLWHIETGRTLRLFAGHTQAVTCTDFHPNCLYLATGSADKNVRLWSIDNGTPLRLFHGLKGTVYGVEFNPAGGTFASVSDDKRVRIWDVLTSKCVQDFKHKGEPITKLTWNKQGSELCTGALDGAVRVWTVCAGSVKENHGSSNSNDSKNQEPSISLNVNSRILDLEYSLETFACVTTT